MDKPNQIGQVSIQREEEKCIKDIRKYRGPDTDSDHFFVEIKMKESPWLKTTGAKAQ